MSLIIIKTLFELSIVLLLIYGFIHEKDVICALNEAVVYEKVDLNYIERILISWMNKGLSVQDVENGKR